MSDGTSLGEPELANLSRLLDQAARDPTILLARACVGDARQFIARGESTAAQRSIAAAQLAIRLSGHATTLGLGPYLPSSAAAAVPAASDPPRPPSRPVLD